jgi:dCTP deaminase
MVLSDEEIVRRVEREGMIDPFVDHQESSGVVSFGLSSYGYDFRVAGAFKVFVGAGMGTIDPKALDVAWADVEAHDYCVVPPRSFALGQSLEYFRIPRDIITVCFGKSTYARCGIILNVTPFEPGWEGHATLGIINPTPLPARVYANEGIGQILFLRASAECRVSYKDRKGRYDKQQGIVTARVKR